MPQIFISYSRVDKPFIEQFEKRFRSAFRDYVVWYDTELVGGDIWWEAILDAIGKCDIFIYLLSNESVNSEYCRAEYNEACRLKKRIVPIMVRDRTKLPPDLSDIQYVNMSSGVNDPDAWLGLVAAIRKQASLIPWRTPRPLSTTRTVRPGSVSEIKTPTTDNTSASTSAQPEIAVPSLPVKSRLAGCRGAFREWANLSVWITGFIVFLIAGIGIICNVAGNALHMFPVHTPTATVEFPPGQPTLTQDAGISKVWSPGVYNADEVKQMLLVFTNLMTPDRTIDGTQHYFFEQYFDFAGSGVIIYRRTGIDYGGMALCLENGPNILYCNDIDNNAHGGFGNPSEPVEVYAPEYGQYRLSIVPGLGANIEINKIEILRETLFTVTRTPVPTLDPGG